MDAGMTVELSADLIKSARTTMSFDIPADMHARVAAIPDLGIRIEMLLRYEAELEARRTKRYGTEARAIAAGAVANANRLQMSEEDWDASF